MPFKIAPVLFGHMPRHTRILGSILIVLMVLGCVELMSYLISAYLVKYPIGFTPLHITESYDSYLAKYHPWLAWKSNVWDDDGNYHNPPGSGPSSPGAAQGQDPARVSLYGESFTEGFGVDPKDSWSNLLSQLLRGRVANFGVSGYGTDQAYLRFLHNDRDRAPVVILGFLSENIMRNVNQLRNLISPANACFLKPRFILNEQGQLSLAANPRLTREQYDALGKNPESVLTHEFFLPGSSSGYRRLEFPYTWGFVRVFPLVFKNLVLRQGAYYELYRPGHPSQAVAITSGIMEAFAREARRRDQKPLILIIPTHVDLAYYRRHGVWVYRPLTDMLAQKGLDFLDAGPSLIKTLGDAPLETLYSPQTMYHLNEKGHAVLAGMVYDYLIRRDPQLGGNRKN